MRICPSCGRENEPDFRFCPACGADIEAGQGSERRQLATLLFCDVSGSTAMGERLDAESVRDIMFMYFHEMRSAIERHGGTVEKFIGDAVMAVFGVPTAHEDDPMRAVRAAWEMQQHMSVLNEEFARRFGSQIALRIGVNTGEVVAGDATSRQTIITGDAANVAARLEQAAEPGDVLIGDQTYGLVRDVVQVQAVAPLAMKGKAKPVLAHRLVSVESLAVGRAPRRDAPLVGRNAELVALATAFDRAMSDRCAVLSLVVGTPGVGKSRLATEFLAGIEATVLSGRCLSYGEGITYWPLREAVKQAAGIIDEDSQEAARTKIGRLVLDEERGALIADRVVQALGLAPGVAPAEEIDWAFRRLFQAMARERPLVVLIDDLQWAEAALLDLLEHLVGQASDVQLLLLCLGRPELLEERPGWGNEPLLIEPLEDADSARLLDDLLGEADLSETERARVIGAAGGNPLFVEELLALTLEDSNLEIPLTLELLLAVRLGRLSRDERSAAERAAVEGEVFHRGAVVELSEPSERRNVPAALARLADHGLIRTTQASFATEAAYKFRHILIRDAAYRATLKKLRAELHERFADWLERIAGERVTEYEEILGFHLEQAYRYREDLGSTAPYRDLAQRAAKWLGSAGTRAAGRGDAGAAIKLLERTLALLSKDAPGRPELLLMLGESLWGGLDPRAEKAFEASAEAAASAGRRDIEASARLSLAYVGTHLNRGGGTADLRRAAEEWLPVAEELGDDRALAKGWFALGNLEFAALHFADSARLFERSMTRARRRGLAKDELDSTFWMSKALGHGPEPVEEAIWRLEQLAEQATTLAARAILLEMVGLMHAHAGRFPTAYALVAEAKATFEDLGLQYLLLDLRGLVEAQIAELAGDLATAERAIRWGCTNLEVIGETGALSTLQGVLATFLCDQGHYEKAEALTLQSEQIADSDDLMTQVWWRCPRARASARRGALADAETLAREACAIADGGDYLELRGRSREALAEVLHLAERNEEAERVLRDAVTIYERKGSGPLAERARAFATRNRS
jgi:class 3 adenylate cyclase